jgi:hypothetical protein
VPAVIDRLDALDAGLRARRGDAGALVANGDAASGTANTREAPGAPR